MNENGIGRRDFFKAMVGCGAAWLGMRVLQPAAWGVPAFQRPGPPRLLLGLAAYSFRDYFNTGAENGNVPGKRIDLFQFIDFCAENGCQGAEVTSYYFPQNTTTEFLLQLKRHAFLRGVELSGTAVGNTFTVPAGERRDEQMALVKRWIDRAYILGAPHVRVFAGNAEGTSKEQAKKQCIAALEECAEYAGQKGVMLGIENHGGIVSEASDLIDIVQAVRSRWVGVNLDTGNFHTADPYGDLERCAPYAVNVQFKVEMRARGGGKEATDTDRVVQILRRANYQGYVALEYEAAEDPWRAVPEHLERLRRAIHG